MFVPNVIINNIIYQTTGIMVEDEDFEISGKTKLSVDGTEIPHRNNQYNLLNIILVLEWNMRL